MLEVLTGKQAGARVGGLEAGAPSEGYESLLELWCEDLLEDPQSPLISANLPRSPLITRYEELLEEPDRLLKMLDPHAGAEAGRWASHTQSVRELHTIAERCLEPLKKRRVEVRAGDGPRSAHPRATLSSLPEQASLTLRWWTGRRCVSWSRSWRRCERAPSRRRTSCATSSAARSLSSRWSTPCAR